MKNFKMIILDTNIIIQIFKGDEKTLKILEDLKGNEFSISVVTTMELFYGALNKRELNKIKNFLSNFKLLAINEDISILALDLIEKYSKSHGLEIPDALIAATALHYKVPLLTYNKKDFRYIENIQLLPF